MRNNKVIYLVYVEYGNKKHIDVASIFDHYSNAYGCKVIRVRTDLERGCTIDNINEAFEFSGYQEGLTIALNDFSLRFSDLDGDAYCNVVFINDTWLDSHINTLAYRLVEKLIQRNVEVIDSPTFIGLQMKTNNEIRQIADSNFYISTWAFALTASPNALKNVLFYSKKEVENLSNNDEIDQLPLNYRRYLNQWLRPTSILGGWYKAIPSLILPESEYIRKIITIYLEHSLPARLAKLGFINLDISNQLSSSDAFIISGLRFVDKVFVNFIKIKLRMRYFISRWLS